MGKFNMPDNRDQLKALARKKKEKALAKEKAQGSNLKRKETETSQAKKLTLSKKPRTRRKPRTLNEEVGVESTGRKSTSELVVVGSLKNKGKEDIHEIGKATKPSSDLINLKPFINDVVQALARSTSRKSISPRSDSQNFRLAFNKSAMALYAQHEMLCKFESLEGSLRDHIADLVRQLAEAEKEVESANILLKKRDEALTRSETLKKEADEVIEVLRSDMAAAQKKKDVEVEKLQDQIVGLHQKVDQLLEDIEKLKGGEGVDLEAVIDWVKFAEIKDCIEDAVGDELIKRINAAHPEWDLSFLTEGGNEFESEEVDPTKGMAGDKGREVDRAMGERVEVDRNVKVESV